MRKKALGTLAAIASAAALLLPATGASAATRSTDALSGLASGHLQTPIQKNQCMLAFASGSVGQKATTYDCLGYDDQIWYYPQPGTTGPIINKYSLLYLTAQGTGDSDAFMYYNSGYPDQQWTAEVEGNMIWFRNVNSGKCLTNDYGHLLQMSCIPAVSQTWNRW